MKVINPHKLLTFAAFSIALVIALSNSAAGQSSGGGSNNIGAGNVQVSGAGGFAENANGGGPGPNSQGGTYSAGIALPINFYVYGVEGEGQYVLASCVGANENTGQGSAIYSSKSYSNIATQFSWTPPGPGTYYIQCRAQYVPSSNPSVNGGPSGGVATTGEIIFNIQ
ncbi:MAG: hypothetical protein M1568_01645 [Acidobacteria bacterium]|nr:hypothetical protein [Acidobacteriota bacterium]